MGLVGIIEGLPAGLKLSENDINDYLIRRQVSHGRGTRMKRIERDWVTITAGVRNGCTLCISVALQIPRPRHADLAGMMKYSFDDIQNVIERASARETAIRTAVGTVALRLLGEFDIDIASHTVGIGKVKTKSTNLTPAEIRERVKKSPVYCVNEKKTLQMITAIDNAREAGQTLGGSFEIIAYPVPPGLGSYVHWDRKLEGLLAQAIMSIPSVKAVEIGDGIANAARPGGQVHDKLTAKRGMNPRLTNRAGGTEGGGVQRGSDHCPGVCQTDLKFASTLGFSACGFKKEDQGALCSFRCLCCPGYRGYW